LRKLKTGSVVVLKRKRNHNRDVNVVRVVYAIKNLMRKRLAEGFMKLTGDGNNEKKIASSSKRCDGSMTLVSSTETADGDGSKKEEMDSQSSDGEARRLKTELDYCFSYLQEGINSPTIKKE